MPTLYEKYRPRTLEDVAGQGAIVNRIKFLQSRGSLVGKAFWIKGPSATGKTTLAKILAASVSDETAIEEIDAQDLSLDLVRKFSDKCRCRPLFGEGYSFIVNEAHNLMTKVVSMLQTVLEEEHVQRNGLWCFTTTNKGHRKLFEDKFDSGPFVSRTIALELVVTPDQMIEYAQRLQWIAEQENLGNGAELQHYAQLWKSCDFNFRAAIGELEAGYMFTQSADPA